MRTRNQRMRSAGRRLATPGGAAWSPASLAGLGLWLTAGPAWCFTDAGGTTPAGVGGAVYTWKDRSAAAGTATQSTALNRPTLAAGYGVHFNGSNWTVLGAAVDPTQHGALYIVITATGDSSPYGKITATTTQFRYGQGSVNEISAFNGSDNPESSALTTAQGTRTALGWVFSGTQVTFYENGTAKGTFAFAALTQNFPDAIGAINSGLSLPLNGDIHELVVATTALATTDRVSLDSYFRAAWGTP